MRITALKWIPFAGNQISDWVKGATPELLESLSNTLGDIVIYNEVNERSEFYKIRKDILNGAVNAVKYLIEPDENGTAFYCHIVLAGHSLGSQITFDAINRITHMVNTGEINGYDKEGLSTNNNGNIISKRLRTFITFGSPLDKIAFFLHEQTKENAHLRRQILSNFHCFKQRPLNEELLPKEKRIPQSLKVNTVFNRVFEEINWVNYWDGRDYVSGELDYYHKLINVNCSYNKGVFKFTHSNYWIDSVFYTHVLKQITN